MLSTPDVNAENQQAVQQVIWKIAVFRPLRKILDYLPPRGYENMRVQAGMRVKIPMGSREIIGLFLGTDTQASVPRHKLRRVSAVIDAQAIIDNKLIELMRWASAYYHHPIGDVFCTSIPGLLRQGKPAQAESEIIYVITEQGSHYPEAHFRRAPAQARALRLFKREQQLTPRRIKEETISKKILQALIEKGLIEASFSSRMRQIRPLPAAECVATKLVLNAEQQRAYEQIAAGLNAFNVFLLEGVTGSGKTEIYLQLIETVLQQDKQALLLIPEIGLTPQTLSRFQQRFAVPIAVFHSSLTERQRLDAWLAAKNGSARIVIGTRSAVFAPLKGLGLILLDEEHDASFKQQEGFRYSARDLAIKRAQQENIPVVLGSATPSLESIYNGRQGKYHCARLSRRAGAAALPRFEILDIRNLKLHQGLSAPLVQRIKAHLEREGQVLVFLNRRGFAPNLICHACGWSAQCRRCDARLTLHQQPARLICHHCGVQQKIYPHCPQCQNKSLVPLGLGTERIEQALHEQFPDAGILRIDRDTTRKKGALEAKLEMMHQGEKRIFVGTQMLAKGHHFPRISLAAIVDADGGFLSADLRASERMGQLITQVAGRSGRSEKAGEVVIQTRFPDNPLLQILIRDGYAAFAERLLQERKFAQLPPYGYLALFRAEAYTLEKVFAFLDNLKQLTTNAEQELHVCGPVPAPLSRKAGKFRGQLLLQAQRRDVLHALLDVLVTQIETLKLASSVKWSLDVDPQDLF